MGRLRSAMETISRQLGRLPMAGKLLIASLAAIVLMVLLLVAVQSSKVTMVELMPGATPEEQVRARSSLEGYDIQAKMISGKLHVPQDKQRQALAMLGQDGKLPQNTQFLFSSLLNQSNWMDSRAQTEFKQNQALQNELSVIISGFRGVERATVLISSPEPMGLGAAVRKPTASVSVTMKPGKAIDKEMIDAVAAMVSGASAGLSVTDVKVIDATTGRQHTARSAADFRTGDYMEHVTKIEEKVQGKLLDALRYIPQVIIAVSAQADVTRKSLITDKILPAGQGSLVADTSDSSTTKNHTSAAPGSEAGVTANLGQDVNNGSSAGGSKTADSTTEVKTQIIPGKSHEEIQDPRGMPTRINVIISLPREYVIALIKQAKPAAAAAPGSAPAADKDKDVEPTQAEIEAKFKEEKTRLEADLQQLVATTAIEAPGAAKDEGQRSVTVSMIPVPMNLVMVGGMPGAMAGLGGGGGGMLNDVLGSGMIRTGVLGAVVIGAMGMMFMLVRKSAKPIELPTAQEIVGLPPALESTNDLVGEADEGQQAMMGIELDDDEMRHKKMLEQVQDLVKKNPTDSAALLNRWMQSEA